MFSEKPSRIFFVVKQCRKRWRKSQQTLCKINFFLVDVLGKILIWVPCSPTPGGFPVNTLSLSVGGTCDSPLIKYDEGDEDRMQSSWLGYI